VERFLGRAVSSELRTQCLAELFLAVGGGAFTGFLGFVEIGFLMAHRGLFSPALFDLPRFGSLIFGLF